MLVGHTHWPMAVTLGDVQMAGFGSVSNGFPPDLRAKYGLLEADRAGYRLESFRISYDREAVIRQLAQVGHPATAFIVRMMRGEIRPPWGGAGQDSHEPDW